MIAALALAVLTGTVGSRWYVTPAFTTFLVFLMLLYGNPGQAVGRFVERVLETLFGIGVAYVFGILVPQCDAASAVPGGLAGRPGHRGGHDRRVVPDAEHQ